MFACAPARRIVTLVAAVLVRGTQVRGFYRY
jgi:hypothetical protein